VTKVALVIAVAEMRGEFSYIAFADRLATQRAKTVCARASPIHQYESHVRLPSCADRVAICAQYGANTATSDVTSVTDLLKSGGRSEERQPCVRAECQQADAHGIAPGHEPVAVVLDLVNPARSRRRLVGWRREAGFDGAGRGSAAGGSERGNGGKDRSGLGGIPAMSPNRKHVYHVI
jgi:hypothetical protein